MQGAANGTAPLFVGGYHGCVHGYVQHVDVKLKNVYL